MSERERISMNSGTCSICGQGFLDVSGAIQWNRSYISCVACFERGRKALLSTLYDKLRVEHRGYPYNRLEGQYGT